MKLKYYLRGMGVGIILATVLLTVSFYFGKTGLAKRDLTDEEIRQRATELGMVMPESEDTSIENEETQSKDSAEPSEEKTEATNDINADEENKPTTEDVDADNLEEFVEKDEPDSAKEATDTKVTYVPFTVKPGESSDMVAANLYKSGLVDSGTNFNKYMNSTGVDNRIQSGTFYVKEGSTYDDIIALLVNKETRTTTPPKAE